MGKFFGQVDAIWIGERAMRLHRNFSFHDDAGEVWVAPAGTVIDGASIPQMFWRTFGPPFVGKYRYASVVHDHYCATKERTSKKTHRMFYEACLAGGVSRRKAKMMHWAIKRFGPKW